MDTLVEQLRRGETGTDGEIIRERKKNGSRKKRKMDRVCGCVVVGGVDMLHSMQTEVRIECVYYIPITHAVPSRYIGYFVECFFFLAINLAEMNDLLDDLGPQQQYH